MSAHRDSILMRMENVNVSKVAFYKANIYTHKCFPNIACYPVLVANCTVIRGEGKVIVALDLQNYLSTDILPYSTHCSIYAANNIYCNAAVTKEVDKSGGFWQSNTHPWTILACHKLFVILPAHSQPCMNDKMFFNA